MLETHGVKTGITPCEGWHYVQPLADGECQRIPPSGRADSDKDLVNQVRAFRVQHGIELGDVLRDIADYIRARSPQNAKRAKGAARISHKPGFVPLIERCRSWLLTEGTKRLRLVGEYDAGERVGICAGCPHNVQWKTGCLPCCEDVELRGQNLRQRVESKADALLACRIHGFFLPAAVYLDRDHLSEHPNQPTHCWAKARPQT